MAAIELKLYRHLWGVAAPAETAVRGFAGEGYAGIECPLDKADETPAFAELLSSLSLEWRGMAFTTGATVAEHVASFRQQVERAAALGVRRLTSHSGRDAFDDAEAAAFFAGALEVEADSPVQVDHETHRGRTLYNPWRTRDLLEKFERLHLCADFSHFACVAERLDWASSDGGRGLAVMVERCRHVHARVGYPEGPQVPDPSAPEWAGAVAAHFRLWDAVRDAALVAGRSELTMTPEFGPPGYLHTLPHTGLPVADLATVCRWMADRLTERYGPPAG